MLEQDENRKDEPRISRPSSESGSVQVFEIFLEDPIENLLGNGEDLECQKNADKREVPKKLEPEVTPLP